MFEFVIFPPIKYMFYNVKIQIKYMYIYVFIYLCNYSKK